jgi:hypothetical protein
VANGDSDDDPDGGPSDAVGVAGRIADVGVDLASAVAVVAVGAAVDPAQPAVTSATAMTTAATRLQAMANSPIGRS